MTTVLMVRAALVVRDDDEDQLSYRNGGRHG
jgi:hypothetical protein